MGGERVNSKHLTLKATTQIWTKARKVPRALLATWTRPRNRGRKGPAAPEALRQRDAIFQFHGQITFITIYVVHLHLSLTFLILRLTTPKFKKSMVISYCIQSFRTYIHYVQRCLPFWTFSCLYFYQNFLQLNRTTWKSRWDKKRIAGIRPNTQKRKSSQIFTVLWYSWWMFIAFTYTQSMFIEF